MKKKIKTALISVSDKRNLKPLLNVLSKNKDTRVHLFHEGMNIYSDYALFYKASNSFKANGNVVVKQGDSITMISENLDYDGNKLSLIHI